MGTYVDAREKTRNNLVNAFWDLYCQKDINKITIKEITDRAGYNRATFYIYFLYLFQERPAGARLRRGAALRHHAGAKPKAAVQQRF